MARRGIPPPQEILKPKDWLLLTESEKREAERWEVRMQNAISAECLAYDRRWRAAAAVPEEWRRNYPEWDRSKLPSPNESETEIAAARQAKLEAERALRQLVMLAESRRQSKHDN